MRASRLFSIVLLLQNRGLMTAQALADELEVSVRTVYRDIEALSGAGIPVYGDSGHRGGYRLLDGYRTRLTGLHADEAESLFLAGVPDAAAELGLGAELAAAQLKLAAALPPELRDRAGRIRERFHLDAPGWYREAEPAPFLAALAEAVWNQRTVRVLYHRWARPQDVERRLDPYGLVLKAGNWYVVAAAHGAGPAAPRTYRVSQILEFQAVDESFDRPESFDLAEYWRAYLGDYDARRFRIEARVRLRAAALPGLPERMDAATARAVAASATEPDPAGLVEAVLPIESVDHAVPLVLSLGTDIEVLEPAELRSRIADTVAALQRAYGAAPAAPTAPAATVPAATPS